MNHTQTIGLSSSALTGDQLVKKRETLGSYGIKNDTGINRWNTRVKLELLQNYCCCQLIYVSEKKENYLEVTRL